MNLGFAVFLSTIIVCLTLLYINKKNTWNWQIIGKIIKWAIIIFVALILLIFAFVVINSYLDSLPKKLTEFHGVKLGETKQDVVDSFGEPKDKEQYAKGHILTYSFGANIENISFSDNDRVFEVTYQEGAKSGFGKYDELNNKLLIKDKYGKPTSVVKTWNGFATRWEYPKYNMYCEFIGDDNKVWVAGMYDPKYKR